MQQLNQLIEKNLPNLASEPASDNFEEVELTEAETVAALKAARHAKANQLRIQKNREEYEQKVREANQPIKIGAKEFYAWILKQAQDKFRGFVVDDHNKDLLRMLSMYFTSDQRFETEYGKDLSKGILLVGTRPGQGKTWLMKLFQQNPVCSYRWVTCLDVAADYQRHPDSGGGVASLDYYAAQAGPMYSNAFRHTAGGFCFDDLGVEQIAKSMGNECDTMMSILQMRYNSLHRYDLPLGFRTTHITTNLTAEQIEARYDSRIRSRMREMFNQIEIPETTPDRRK
ncbi:hypothetical protein [Spirosoma oryzicola]|uniref:hypothetical protein n=1 Tax=Spirosoma oryzicola TaxID=2898794 RepID=UPI001E6132BF|nr:hypothetical protein [Spirosoma oryzicola]UHG93296.1 hypothetical protein LQ777_10425 [Spirosoma oryzicola]